MLKRACLCSVLSGVAVLTGCDSAATRAPSAPVEASDAAAESTDRADKPQAIVPAEEPPPAPISGAEGASASRPLPADVAAFKMRRDQCDHFRGEEATDDARAAELERKLESTCAGTDAKLAALRRRHAGDPVASAALAAYDAEIE